MRLCFLENESVHSLEPLIWARPACDLWAGSLRVGELLRLWADARECAYLGRPYIAEYVRLAHPDWTVDDKDWFKDGPVVFVDSVWLPKDRRLAMPEAWRVGLCQEEPVYAVLPGELAYNVAACILEEGLSFAEALATVARSVPTASAQGVRIRYLWELIEAASVYFDRDVRICGAYPGWRDARDLGHAGVVVLGPPERVVVHESATVEPLVVLDARQGPIVLDAGARVAAFSRIDGPSYVGQDTWVLAAHVKESIVGPVCRIAGEIEKSILQGFSNKQHEGFLGHSYIGEWVNLAAATQVADLRNDYGTIAVSIGGCRVGSGRMKLGALIGDHTKSGLGTLINAGSVLGVFCQVLPSAGYAPRVIPSFCRYRDGELQELWELEPLFATAQRVMSRRQCTWTETHERLFRAVWQETAGQRQAALRAGPHRLTPPAVPG
ncbi:MAG: hypothetical protein C4297_05630 [Gemmataceae bacterium]